MTKRKQNKPSAEILILALLFFLFPPLSAIGAAFLFVHKWGRKKASGEDSPFRADVQMIGASKEKFLRRQKEENVAERPYKSHPHTPVSYSYDACAQEKRLEQLNVLRRAGLLDEVEYQQRKQDILNLH